MNSNQMLSTVIAVTRIADRRDDDLGSDATAHKNNARLVKFSALKNNEDGCLLRSRTLFCCEILQLHHAAQEKFYLVLVTLPSKTPPRSISNSP